MIEVQFNQGRNEFRPPLSTVIRDHDDQAVKLLLGELAYVWWPNFTEARRGLAKLAEPVV